MEHCLWLTKTWRHTTHDFYNRDSKTVVILEASGYWLSSICVFLQFTGALPHLSQTDWPADGQRDRSSQMAEGDPHLQEQVSAQEQGLLQQTAVNNSLRDRSYRSKCKQACNVHLQNKLWNLSLGQSVQISDYDSSQSPWLRSRFVVVWMLRK